MTASTSAKNEDEDLGQEEELDVLPQRPSDAGNDVSKTSAEKKVRWTASSRARLTTM